jgi:GTPase
LDADTLAPVALSAASGEGIDSLLAAIDRAAFSATRIVTLQLEPGDGKTRAQIASCGRILEETHDDEGRTMLKAELLVADAARFAPYEPPPEDMRPAAE